MARRPTSPDPDEIQPVVDNARPRDTTGSRPEPRDFPDYATDARDTQWREWAPKDYPDWVQQTTREINENAGLDPLDSYGYRQVYRLWVEDEDDIEAYTDYLAEYDITPA